MLEYIILGFLMKKPMSGYAIRRKIKISTSNFYSASFGSIYPALRRMKKKSLIIPSGQDTGENKIEYKITETGEKVFLEWLKQPVNPSAVSHEHILRLFFFGHIPGNYIEILLADFIHEIRNKNRELDRIEVIVREGVDEFEMASLDFGRDYYNFIEKWYSSFLDKFIKKNRSK